MSGSGIFLDGEWLRVGMATPKSEERRQEFLRMRCGGPEQTRRHWGNRNRAPEVHREMLLAGDGQKRQPTEIDGDSVMVGDEVEMSEARPAEKPARPGGSKSMET